MFLKILSNLRNQVEVFIQQTYRRVMRVANERSDRSGFMVVINAKATTIRRLTTDCAQSVLSLNHRFVLLARHPVLQVQSAAIKSLFSRRGLFIRTRFSNQFCSMARVRIPLLVLGALALTTLAFKPIPTKSHLRKAVKLQHPSAPQTFFALNAINEKVWLMARPAFGLMCAVALTTPCKQTVFESAIRTKRGGGQDLLALTTKFLGRERKSDLLYSGFSHAACAPSQVNW